MEKDIADMKSTPTFCAWAGAVTVTGDFGGELIMPDYYPEIRKIVTVKASVLPDSKYIHDKELETGGTICFSVLYIGDDQTLSCVPYVTEYSQVTQVEDEGISQDSIIIESIAENVSARPLGPRKISLKARVRSRISFDRYEMYQPMITGRDRSALDPARRRSIERLEKKVPCIEKKLYTMTGSVKGDFETEGIMKPVMCWGDILINEVKPESKIITIKGEAAISTVVQLSDGTYKTVCNTVTFEDRVDGENIHKGTRAVVFGRLASVSATLDDDGKTLFFEVEYDLDVCAINEGSITVTDDAYSREYEMEGIHREIKNQSLMCASNLTVPITCEGRRKGAKTADDFPVFCIGEPRIERADAVKGKIMISGVCNFSAYIASGGEIVTEEFSCPFAVEAPVLEENSPGDVCYSARAVASGCTCVLQDQKIKADCRVSISVAAFSVNTVLPLYEATVGEKTRGQGDACMVRVCYPEKGRQIWDIAKEYKTSISLCEKLNKKSRTDLCDGTPVIVK